MSYKIFQDTNGNTSSTRIFEVVIIFTIISITYISIFTEKDIGNNIADMLQFVSSFVIASCEGKKAVEFLSKKK